MTVERTKVSSAQLIFTAKKENRFVAHVISMLTFGFPITIFDM